MERVIIQQDRDFRISVSAQREGDSDSRPVTHIHDLSPYGMVLASLGLCTGVVIHTYAQHHEVDLEVAEMEVAYHREYGDDSLSEGSYVEWIEETMRFEGDLTKKERGRLTHVGHQCSIRKMLTSGIEIRTEQATGRGEGT